LTSASENQSPSLRAAPLSAKDLCSLFLPITTPFLSDQTLDVNGLRANIRKWNQTGIAGYVVMGSTGERVHLDEGEYVQVITESRREVTGDLFLIAGAGQQSTVGTIAEIRRAANAGVDAVLVITPNFYRAAITSDVLIKHYREIADASPVPVILYSMPDLTGVKIEPQTVATLSAHPNIIGIKDSSADLAKLRETINLVGNAADEGKRFAILTGNGTVFQGALSAGADGGILAVGCVGTDLCLQIFRAMQAGDNVRAERLQQDLTPLAMAVTRKYGIGGLKAALDMIGYTGGAVRAPLQAAEDEAHAEIREHLETALRNEVSKESPVRSG
jgi:4-hydroxy-2-oxoglutarate aldolase